MRRLPDNGSFLTSMCVAVGLAAAVGAVPRSIEATAAGPPPPCGTVIANATLAADCTGPLQLTASSIHVNLNGHTVTCGGDPNLIGILVVGQMGVHINNGTVSGCGTGIAVVQGGSHTLSALRVVSNVCCGVGGPGDGISLNQSSGNHISGSAASLNASAGVRLVESDGNALNAVVMDSNKGRPEESAGLIIVRSNDNLVTSSDASNNGHAGILIHDQSRRNAILDSTVNGNNLSGNPAPGINIVDSFDTIIRGNIATGNGWGIQLTPNSAGTVVQSNTASQNAFYGVLLFVGATGNSFQSNTALQNGIFDLFDPNAGCDSNIWKSNVFGTANASCIA